MRKKMKICIENEDTVFIKNNCIEIHTESEDYCFDGSEIQEINIITSAMGPFYDDMCLAIEIGKGEPAVVFIMSEHPLYSSLLFDGLKQLVELNYKAVIEASSCTEEKLFPIYRREAEV